MIVYKSPPVNELSVTSSATGYPLAFLVDWRTYTWWRAEDTAEQMITWSPAVATSISDLLISGHNFGAVGASVVLEASDDGFAADVVQVVAPEFVASDEVFYRRFALASKQVYRLRIYGQSSPLQIAILSLGKAFVFEHPIIGTYTPVKEESKSSVEIAQKGALLGTVESHVALSAKVDVERLSDAWVRTQYQPLWDARLGRLAPFFWLHNYSFAPTDIFLMRMKDGKLSMPYTEGGERKITLDMVGYK